MRIGETIDSLVKEAGLETPESVAQLVAKVNPGKSKAAKEAIWSLNRAPERIARVMIATHPENEDVIQQKYREARDQQRAKGRMDPGEDPTALEMILQEIDNEQYQSIKELTGIVLKRKDLHITVEQLRSTLDYCHDFACDLEVMTSCVLHEPKEMLFLTKQSLVQIQPKAFRIHLLQDLDRVELVVNAEGLPSYLAINQHKSPQHPALFQWALSRPPTKDTQTLLRFATDLVRALHKQ